jgi:hypothetical protein
MHAADTPPPDKGVGDDPLRGSHTTDKGVADDPPYGSTTGFSTDKEQLASLAGSPTGEQVSAEAKASRRIVGGLIGDRWLETDGSYAHWADEDLEALATEITYRLEDVGHYPRDPGVILSRLHKGDRIWNIIGSEMKGLHHP